jgi:hypothetical protein
MRVFLWNYTKPIGACRWQAALLMTANGYMKNLLASRFRQWTRAYILDRNDLPLNIYGTWNSSILEDEDFKGELLHLQGIGKYVKPVRSNFGSIMITPNHDSSRFSTRSIRFMDGYRRGLDGKQVAWASKQYRGHRVLPETILADLETTNLL